MFTEMERMFATDEIGIDALPRGAAPRMRLVPLPPLRPEAGAAEGETAEVASVSSRASSSSPRRSASRRSRASSSSPRRSASRRRSVLHFISFVSILFFAHSILLFASRRSTFFYAEGDIEGSANAGAPGAARIGCCALSARKRLKLSLAIVRFAQWAPAKLFLALCTRKRKVLAEALVDAPRVCFAVEMVAGAQAGAPAARVDARGGGAGADEAPPPLDIWGAATVLELRARIWQCICAAPGLHAHERSLHQCEFATELVHKASGRCVNLASLA